MIPALRADPTELSVLETHFGGLRVSATWGDNATIRRGSRLLPKPVLLAIVDEAKREIACARPEKLATELEASRAAQILIGSYPHVKLHEAKVFINGLRSVLMEYPYATGTRAVDMLTRTSKFLPTRAELLEACQASVRPPGAKYWAALYLAEKQLKEHQEREYDAEIAAQTPEQRARIAAFIRGRYDTPEPTQAEREARADAYETASGPA